MNQYLLSFKENRRIIEWVPLREGDKWLVYEWLDWCCLAPHFHTILPLFFPPYFLPPHLIEIRMSLSGSTADIEHLPNHPADTFVTNILKVNVRYNECSTSLWVLVWGAFSASLSSCSQLTSADADTNCFSVSLSLRCFRNVREKETQPQL